MQQGSMWSANNAMLPGKSQVSSCLGGKGVAGAGLIDEKVRKTIGWYNRNGGLQEEIIFTKVAPALAQVGTAEALKILKGLETKGPEIRNPTAWICKACNS